MTAHSASRSALIREQLGHPVLDGDGHIVELFPVFSDFVRDHGGGPALDSISRWAADRPTR